MGSTSTSIILFLSAFSFFAVFTPMGHLPSDTVYSVATAESIVTRHSLVIERGRAVGIDGQRYSRYGIGYAVLFVPAVAASHLLSTILSVNQEYIRQTIVSFTNTFFAAIIIVQFYWIFLAIGYKRRLSLISVTLIAAGSMLLPYSKIIHAEIPTMILILVFIAALIKNQGITVTTGFLFSSLIAGLLLLKAGNIVYAFSIGVYVIWLLVQRRGSVKGVVVFLVPLLCVGAVQLAFNQHRFGNFFNMGYGTEQVAFTNPVINGLRDFLFSPSKSLFIFSPLIIIALFGISKVSKRNKLLTVTILAICVVNLVFFSKWYAWHGGWGWGPRLMLPAILLFHIFLPEAILWTKGHVGKQILFVIITITAITVNILGALVWYQQIYYFSKDLSQIKNSHVRIAATILTHKIQGNPEVYALRDFGIKGSAFLHPESWNKLCRGDSLDLSGFEKFKGYATLWSGLSNNFGLRWITILPFILLICAGIGGKVLWSNTKPVRTP